MEILKLTGVGFTYPGGREPAIADVSFTVREGEFVVLCGRSGGGKTTLLQQLKPAITPHGERAGEILYMGEPLSSLDERRAAGEIGFVLQSPEAQIVTDKVWHEMAFGLENLGFDRDRIRLRVGEMASYFGITDLFRRDTATLSGGQKQLLNLASVMAMSPKLLLLDEPTSQLDPIAASGFLSTLRKLNRELGVTVLLSEHRLEEALPGADRVLVLDEGRLIADGTPREVCLSLSGHPISAGFPAAVRIRQGLGGAGDCPLTVREGKDYIAAGFAPADVPVREAPAGETAFALSDIWFRYERHSPDILRGATLSVTRGELFCLLGENGAGKTTTLKVLSGLVRPYRGKVLRAGEKRVAFLPQNVDTVFLKDTVREDLADMARVSGVERGKAEDKTAELVRELELSALLERHPGDLSGGERQRAALAKVLISEPDILLLDEPTKGIDAFGKLALSRILRSLCASGVTVLAVTHDVEFAASTADRAALFFDGEILSPSVPQVFFGSNRFYTTSASRISRDLCNGAVTAEDVISACTGREIR